MTTYSPADRRTMYFIGVTTAQSSIMKVFPRWAEHLGLDAVLKGIDFPPNAEPARKACTGVSDVRAKSSAPRGNSTASWLVGADSRWARSTMHRSRHKPSLS